MQKIPQGFDPREIQRLAASAPGQQLMALLNQADPNMMQSAFAKADAGDIEAAKKLLQPLLESQELQRLLKQLGG